MRGPAHPPGADLEPQPRPGGSAGAKALDLPRSGPAPWTILLRRVSEADIISAATMSSNPLIRGEWLRPGQHLDLVGGYREEMREADDEAVRGRASSSTPASPPPPMPATSASRWPGIIADADITDTFELARGEKPGRQNEQEITLFKSGGGGHEDLGTAQHLLAGCREGRCRSSSARRIGGPCRV